MAYWPKRTGKENDRERSRAVSLVQPLPEYREPEIKQPAKKPPQTDDVSPVGQITAADVVPMEAWERQPEESGSAWSAFQTYRDLGPGRTIALTRQAMKTDRNGEYKKLQSWATQYNWEVRALAYDKMIDKKRIDEHVEAAREMTRRHIRRSQLIQEVGMKRLEKMTPAQIAKLKATDAAKLVGQGVDMERLAMGQPTSQSRSVHTGKIKHTDDGQAVKEVREFKQTLMDKLDDIERKRTGTQKIINEHQTPVEEAEQDNGSKHTIRKELLPHVAVMKDHRTN